MNIKNLKLKVKEMHKRYMHIKNDVRDNFNIRRLVLHFHIL